MGSDGTIGVARKTGFERSIWGSGYTSSLGSDLVRLPPCRVAPNRISLSRAPRAFATILRRISTEIRPCQDG